MKKIFKYKQGFTLLELLAVIAIIGVLVAIGTTSYGAAQKKSRDGKRQADLEQIRAALEMFRADSISGGTYPDSLSITAFGNYINPLPSDPKPSYSYQYDLYSSTNYCLGALLEAGVSGGVDCATHTNCGSVPDCTTGTDCNYCVINP